MMCVVRRRAEIVALPLECRTGPSGLNRSMSAVEILRQIGLYEEGPFEKNRSASATAPEMIRKSAIPSGIV